MSSKLSFTAPTALEYFATLVAGDDQFPLLETAISLAQDEYPELDVQQVLGEVDQLAARLQRRMPEDADVLYRLRVLNQFFYRELGFCGNVNHYYDPENSYFNSLLRTRRGIPISLGVLWLELAQGLQLRARGVAFPGHFLVKVNLPKGQVVMDPCDGQSLSREELAERLDPYRSVNASPDEFDVPLGLFLQAAPARDIIARMLHNLAEIHRSQEDWARLLAVLDRLVLLLPGDATQRRDRGLVLAELGQVQAAMQDLESYLTQHPNAHDALVMARRVRELRLSGS